LTGNGNAWIIGGTSGIGAAVAHELRIGGYRVVVTDEHSTNVTDSREIEVFLSVGPTSGKWDHIVYSAGFNKLAWMEAVQEADLMQIFDVNVLGFIRLMSAVARMPIENMPNSVTAIVSDAATHPMRTSIAYCSSKAALAMAVRCAARELASAVRVNGVSPGIVEGTPMTEKTDKEISATRGWIPADVVLNSTEAIPVGRRGFPREIAQVVVDVMEGPQYLTGSIIEVNGGR
jgi:NAD(P)-dependent dehydrogenase (short-subunit alcohol dehydrogenase family)